MPLLTHPFDFGLMTIKINNRLKELRSKVRLIISINISSIKYDQNFLPKSEIKNFRKKSDKQLTSWKGCQFLEIQSLIRNIQMVDDRFADQREFTATVNLFSNIIRISRSWFFRITWSFRGLPLFKVTNISKSFLNAPTLWIIT